MAAGSNWRYYQYEPSHALAYVAISLFAVAWLVQCGWLYKKRAWYMVPFMLACLGESVGYGFRRISADNYVGRGSALTWYILQELFIILCPALMCASYYMCFGRIITYVGNRFTPISSKWVTAIFVGVDIVSFCVQGAGGSLYSSDNTDLYSTAKAVLITGFCVQIVGLGIFTLFAIMYHIRARQAGIPSGPWTTCLWMLYFSAALVLVRGVFRTVEYASGQGGGRGYLLENEAWYYGLESLPILLACVLLSVSYPGAYIPHARSARLFPGSEEAAEAVEGDVEGGRIGASSSTLEEEKVEMEEKRRWWRKA
ncbi:hypothetical protein JCM8547_003638 [Rhodosporidiobolus lusitaniae]